MPEEGGVDGVALAVALGRVRIMQRHDVRTALIEAVGRRLGEPLNVPDFNIASVHISEIVQACEDRIGGLDALVRAVTMLAGTDADAVRFCDLAGPAETAVGAADEDRLRGPLERCAIPEIALLFDHAVDGRVEPPADLRNAWDAFVRLADTNARADGVPPHMAFVVMLGVLLSKDDPPGQGPAGVLRAWVSEHIGRYRANKDDDTADALERLRARSAMSAGPGVPMSLIILLEEDLRRPGRYVVTHWRQKNPIRWSPERAGGELVVAPPEIRGAVIALLKRAEREWARPFRSPLGLEIALPPELLNLPVDQWLGGAADDPAAAPIGALHEVVLRSQQRLREREWHRRWNMRSQVLQAHGPPSDLFRNSQQMVHRCPEEYEGKPRKLLLHLDNREEIVAYLLSSPPDREPGRSELEVAFRMGLPAVIWSRDPGVHEDLWSAVENESALDLPAAVRVMRRDAELDIGAAARIGRHISLVWDIYHRPLDLPPLSAPM